MSGDLNASDAFWQKIRMCIGVKPVADVKKSLRISKLQQYQKLGATVSLYSVKETLSMAFDEAVESSGDRLAGDELDLVSDERDSRLELAAFDKRLGERYPDGFGAENETDAMLADGLDWSDEAAALARDLAADARLERPRRPELSTKPFLLSYFKTLRLFDLGITRIDSGMRDLKNLRKLSLSGNVVPVLTVANLPPLLEVLNMYDCSIRSVRVKTKSSTSERRKRRQNVSNPVSNVQSVGFQLESLLHLGVGYNMIAEDALTSLSHAFPSLTSLDLCNNHLSDTVKVVSTLQQTLPSLEHLLLAGNPIAMEFGYRSRCIVSLPNITRFDDLDLDEDDIRAARRAVQRHNMSIIGVQKDGGPTVEAAVGNIDTRQETVGTKSSKENEEEIEHDSSLNTVGLAPPLGGQEAGAAILRVKVGVLSGMPGPVVTRAESTEEKKDAAEDADPGPVTVSYKCPQSGDDAETMLQDSESIDFRYFLRLVPPGSKGLPQTTAAKVWTYEPGVDFSEFVTMCVPLSANFATDCQFKGLQVEVWASLPGKKSEPKADSEVCEPNEIMEKGENLEDKEPEALSVDESLPPRMDTLVGRGKLDILKFCDPTIDGMVEIGVSNILIEGPPLDKADLLGLRDMQQDVLNAESKSKEEESVEDPESNQGDLQKVKMPRLQLSIALNPTEQPATEDKEEGERPGTKGKGKDKKKKKKK